MTGGKVRHYPYFVGLFHISTPLRSVELSKECLDYPAIREMFISEGCQTYVTSHFPAQTLCKLKFNLSFCRQNKLILDLRNSLWVASRASFAPSALTRLVASVGSTAWIRLPNKTTSIVRMSRVYATIAKPTEKWFAPLRLSQGRRPGRSYRQGNHASQEKT